MSVNIQAYPSYFMSVWLTRNDVYIGYVRMDDISGVYNRGSTTIVTECDRGDILWVRAGTEGAIYTNPTPTTLFTGHMIHRY